MRKLHIRIAGIIAFVLFLSLDGMSAQASTNFNTYTYDEWDDSVAAPAGYDATKSVSGLQMGTGAWKVPQDFFMDSKGNIYLADTGNERILLINSDLELIDIIETVNMDGEDIPLTDVEGMYITDDAVMYLCQTSLERVLIVKDGKVTGTILRPVSNLIQDDFVFAPTKIGIDVYGRAYVLSKGCYTGFLQFDTDGRFMSFYGANKVEVTGKVLFNYMWKSILSDEQRAAMTSIIPIEYSNLDCSKDGFVYTSTVGTQIPKNQIKKLNPLGNNIYYTEGKEEFNFGDEEMTYLQGKAIQPAFTDVKVNDEGFIFASDLNSGRIFERDQEGNLISVFGGFGNQLGTFQAPVAVECYNGKVYVLDRLKGSITIFEKTEYGALVEEALNLYNEGKYEESMVVWKSVLQRNSNSVLANTGMGKALSQSGEYSDSLNYLKYSGDKYSYSKAFGKHRLNLVKVYGVYFLVALIVLAVSTTVVKRILKVRRRKKDENKISKK